MTGKRYVNIGMWELRWGAYPGKAYSCTSQIQGNFIFFLSRLQFDWYFCSIWEPKLQLVDLENNESVLVFPCIWFSTKGKNRILEPIITRETRNPVYIQQCCAVHTRLKPAPQYSQLYFFCSYLNPELPLLLSLSLVFHV